MTRLRQPQVATTFGSMTTSVALLLAIFLIVSAIWQPLVSATTSSSTTLALQFQMPPPMIPIWTNDDS